MDDSSTSLISELILLLSMEMMTKDVVVVVVDAVGGGLQMCQLMALSMRLTGWHRTE